MDSIQVWAEGYKARGEACKQGGFLSTVLLGILGAVSQVSVINYAWPAFFLGGAVVLSALSYWLAGLSLTTLSTRLGDKPLTIKDVTPLNSPWTWANITGALEVIALLIGLGLSVNEISYAKPKPSSTAVTVVPAPSSSTTQSSASGGRGLDLRGDSKMDVKDLILPLVASLWAATTLVLTATKELNRIRDCIVCGTQDGKGELNIEHRRYMILSDWLPTAVCTLLVCIGFGVICAFAPFLLPSDKLTPSGHWISWGAGLFSGIMALAWLVAGWHDWNYMWAAVTNAAPQKGVKAEPPPSPVV